MKYRNIKTGVVVEVNSVVGGNWELIEEPKQETAKEPKKTEAKTQVRKTRKKEV